MFNCTGKPHSPRTYSKEEPENNTSVGLGYHYVTTHGFTFNIVNVWAAFNHHVSSTIFELDCFLHLLLLRLRRPEFFIKVFIRFFYRQCNRY